jgi:hypothetical protein
MIVMINGAFGVGKTSTAHALNEKLPDSVVFDPEEVGYMLRNITYPTGLETPGDFQDISLWPSMVVTVTQALHTQYQRHLILPISLPCHAYFQHIVQGLRTFEPEFYHFCLMASETTLSQRIRAREGESEAGKWAHRQIPRCLKAFMAPEYEEKLDTDTFPLEVIVNTITARIQQPPSAR